MVDVEPVLAGLLTRGLLLQPVSLFWSVPATRGSSRHGWQSESMTGSLWGLAQFEHIPRFFGAQPRIFCRGSGKRGSLSDDFLCCAVIIGT